MATLVSADAVSPGGSGEIRVTLNPAGKFGNVTKTVTIVSNDYTQPSIDVPLFAVVEHGVDSASAEPLEGILFGGECAECHADPAGDLSGAELYDAVCIMCHGPVNEYAASLPSEAQSRDALREWIADGKGDLGMPGYSAKKGGPLTDEQVDTLVEILLIAQDGG